jgi:cathepsin L
MNGDDESMRAKYEANVRRIDELNARDSSATYAVNKFSGMSFDEFASIYLTLKTSPLASSGLPELQLDAVATAQDADWDVTPVKDQGQCGSCWTFGVMGAIEGMNKVTTGNEVILSEQQLVDCDKDGINDGCNGGLTDYAYKYLTGKDLYTLDSYPYVSGQSGHANSCQTGTPSGVGISGYFTVPGSGSGSQGDEALAKALMTGPVTVTVAVDDKFSNYHTGIMSGVSTQCNLNHAILATGFGPNFWKIKNSWGSSWGAQGYAKFERSTSGCGPFGIFFQDAGFQPKMVQQIAV